MLQSLLENQFERIVNLFVAKVKFLKKQFDEHKTEFKARLYNIPLEV